MTRTKISCIVALGSVLGLAGCAAEPAAVARDAHGSGRSAVTYAGDIPCADCAGQHIVLTLFPDSTYRLRRIYRGAAGGRDESVYDLGRWARAQDDGDRVRLSGGEGVQEYRLIGPDRLRMLDRMGKEIRSTFNYDLARQSAVDPVAGPMRLRGMYLYMADAASVAECLTGRTYPVVAEADSLSMERGYLQARQEPGTPVLASFEGRFAARPPEPGLPLRDHVIVERVGTFSPGEACADAPAKTALFGTVWRAVEIAGRPLALPPGGRAPEFALTAEGSRVHGFAGCNRLVGGFEQDGDSFRFKGTATTRMACPPPAGEIEAAFLDALNATASQRIVGDALELRDGSGTVRMRLRPGQRGGTP